jgi:hypothetical protein
MRDWFTKNLGDASMADEAVERIKALFLLEYERSKQPPGMAVFIRHESNGYLHCEVRLYFSPASAPVAQAVDADSCQRPSPTDLGLLAGPQDSWVVLFPVV